MSPPYADLIATVATTYTLDRDLLAAQVQVESSGNPWAFRYEHSFFEQYIRYHPDSQGFPYGPLAACSFGLLQILLETALEMGFADRPERLFVPQVGLSWGAKYLSIQLRKSKGDYHKALAAYNGAGTQAASYADKVFATAGLV